MTTRFSSLALATLVAAALLLPAASATAAPRAALVSPGRDAVVSSPVELRVRVTRDVLEEDVRQVQVRLSADGAGPAAGTRAVSLSCVSGCGSTDSVWTGGTYDPATAAPFGGGPSCNGRWYLQVAIDGGAFGAATPLLASAPASPARDVRVSIEGRDAVVIWGASPEPDVVSYRIERRGDGGSWTIVGETGPEARQFVDPDVAVGAYEWRVVTMRADGRSSGGAAAPCADREPDLATTSSASGGRVTEAPPSPSPSPSDEPTGDATTDTGSPSDGGTDAADGGAGDGDGSAGAPGEGDAGVSSGAPTPAETASPAPGAPAPSDAPSEDPRPAPAEEERFYGEDQGVGLLDYGAAAPADGDATAAAGPAGGTWVPGGVSVTTQDSLDQVRLLRPIAGGMVLLTFAFHLRRWQREQDV